MTPLLVGCQQRPHSVSVALEPQAAAVDISAQLPDEAGIVHGTGFFVSSHGLIVTSRRLLGDRAHITVFRPELGTLAATVVEEDADAEVAILKVPIAQGEGVPRLPYFHLLETDRDPPAHVRVIARGGMIDAMFDHYEHFGRDMDLLVDLPPETTGAAVLDDDGHVVGVVQNALAGQPTQTLATPLWHVLRMMPKLAEGE